MGKPRLTEFLIQHLSVAVQWGNCSSDRQHRLLNWFLFYSHIHLLSLSHHYYIKIVHLFILKLLSHITIVLKLIYRSPQLSVCWSYSCSKILTLYLPIVSPLKEVYSSQNFINLGNLRTVFFCRFVYQFTQVTTLGNYGKLWGFTIKIFGYKENGLFYIISKTCVTSKINASYTVS